MVHSLTSAEILAFFKTNNNKFTNREGVILELIEEEIIAVSYSMFIPACESSGLKMRISGCHYDLDSFINANRIPSLDFLKKKFSCTHLFQRYYEFGEGRIICSLDNYPGLKAAQRIEIIFEHLPRKTEITRISSPQLHFYEELKEGFYEGEQYFDYLKGNIPLFNWWLSKNLSIEFGKNLGRKERQN